MAWGGGGGGDRFQGRVAAGWEDSCFSGRKGGWRVRDKRK